MRIPKTSDLCLVHGEGIPVKGTGTFPLPWIKRVSRAGTGISPAIILILTQLRPPVLLVVLVSLQLLLLLLLRHLTIFITGNTKRATSHCVST